MGRYKPEAKELPDCFFLAKQYSLVKFGNKCVKQTAATYVYTRNVLSDEGMWNSLPGDFVKEVVRLADLRYQTDIDEDQRLADIYQKKKERIAREQARRDSAKKKEIAKQQVKEEPVEETGEEIVFQVAVPKSNSGGGKKKKSKKKGKN